MIEQSDESVTTPSDGRPNDGLPRDGQPDDGLAPAGRPTRLELVLLGGIVAVACVLRLWRLGDIPFGMHPDEGHNALDALRIAHDGWRPAFLPGNNGREALFMYLMAASERLLGPTMFAVRLPAALAGVAAVLAQWLLVRTLFSPRPARLALVSAALVAVGFWPVAQSRYGLRASLLPVWVALLVWAWWRTISDPRIKFGSAAATGAFAGLAILTHLTGRILLIVPGVSALGELAARRGLRAMAAWALAAALAIAVAAPQIVFFLRQPQMLTYRSDQVSILNPEVNDGDLAGALVENARRLLETPVLKGDGSWYHNLRHRPVFDLATAVAFVAGAGLVAADLFGRRGAQGRRQALLLSAALVVTTLPSALSEGAPNYVRMTGAIPVLFLLPAMGLDSAAAAIDRWLGRGLAWDRAGGGPARTRSGTGRILIVGVLAVALAATVRDYFLKYARAPETYEAFNGAAVARGMLLADLGELGSTLAVPDGTAGVRVYVSPAIWNQSVIRFLNYEHPPASFDPRAGLVRPAQGMALYAFDPVEEDAVDEFAARWPMLDAATLEANAFGRETPAGGSVAWSAARLPATQQTSASPALYTFSLPPGAWAEIAPSQAPGWQREDPPQEPGDQRDAIATFDDKIALVGAACEREPEGAAVTLEWEALAPTETDRNFFVRVADGSGTELGSWDGPPLAGSYGTDRWAPGERILQQVDVPTSGGQDGCTVTHGWYDWRTGERLEVPGSAENSVRVSWGAP